MYVVVAGWTGGQGGQLRGVCDELSAGRTLQHGHKRGIRFNKLLHHLAHGISHTGFNFA